MKDFLYVVHSPMRKQVKIGRTINPKSRLYQIGRHVGDRSCEYIMLAVTKDSSSFTRPVDRILAKTELDLVYLESTERRLHRLFDLYRKITHKHYGEWFDECITGDLLYMIEQLIVFDKVYYGRDASIKLSLICPFRFKQFFPFETKEWEEYQLLGQSMVEDARRKREYI